MKKGLIKKLLSFTLAGAIALPLMACGSTAKDDSNKDLLSCIARDHARVR